MSVARRGAAAVWAYVLILIIGVVVTVAGIRIGQRRREDPFADVRAEAEEGESSLRGPARAGAGQTPAGATPVASPPAPKATLEERLREARTARAAEREGDVARPPVSDTSDAPATAEAGAAPETAETSEPETEVETIQGEPAAAESADTERVVNEPVEAEAAGTEEPVIGSAAITEAGPVPAPVHVEIHALEPAAREDFAQRWTPLRMRLLARPGGAIADADAFVRELLDARGLPSDPDDPAMAEASNTYPDLVDPFRLATVIARHAADGAADPQELRLATVHYRDAVDALLAPEDAPVA